MSAKSTIASNLRLISASLMPRIAPLRKRLSRPLSWGWNPAPVAISPAIRPRVRMLPLSGRITPLISLSRVLLPLPLRPIRPMDSPCSTVNDTSLTARNRLLERQSAHGGDRHLLQGAVVLHREVLGDVLHHDRRGSSETLRESVLEAGEEPLREVPRSTRQAASMMKPARPQVGGELVGRSSPDRTVGAQNIRCISRTASASGLREVELVGPPVVLRRASWIIEYGYIIGTRKCMNWVTVCTMFWKSR